MSTDKKASQWSRSRPRAGGMILLGVGVVWILLSWAPLAEAIRETGPDAEGAVALGLLFIATAAGALALAAEIRKRWWVKSNLRSAVILLLQAIPMVGFVAIVPGRGSDVRAGDLICDSWPCYTMTGVASMGAGIALMAWAVFLVARGRAPSTRAFLAGWSRPTGHPCRTDVIQAPEEERGSFFFTCDCGRVGRAWHTAAEAVADAIRHSPAGAPQVDPIASSPSTVAELGWFGAAHAPAQVPPKTSLGRALRRLDSWRDQPSRRINPSILGWFLVVAGVVGCGLGMVHPTQTPPRSFTAVDWVLLGSGGVIWYVGWRLAAPNALRWAFGEHPITWRLRIFVFFGLTLVYPALVVASIVARIVLRQDA